MTPLNKLKIQLSCGKSKQNACELTNKSKNYTPAPPENEPLLDSVKNSSSFEE